MKEREKKMARSGRV